MNLREWHEETVSRMERAVERLEERSAEARYGERERLAAKADGVKLALSYFRDIPKDAVEEAGPAMCGASHQAIDNGAECRYLAGHLEAKIPHTTANGFWWFE